jgi:hypothetical protein
MIAPGVWLAAPPSLPTAFIVGHGLLRIGGTGKPPRRHVLAMLGDARGFLGLSGGICHRRLVSQLARVDHQKAYLCHVEAPVRILHGHAADDTLPMPAARRLRAGSSRFFKQQRQRTMLLAPRL